MPTFYVDDISLQAASGPSPLVFTTGPARHDGQLEFWLAGPAGQGFVLQASTNLMGWRPVQTNTVGAAPFHFVAPAEAAPQFYRAVSTP